MKVCIIGSGLSGLIAAKEALESGKDVDIFDIRGEVGGLFNNDDWANDKLDGNSIKAYDLHLTISNTLMVFSSLPCEKGEERRMWSRQDYVDYLARFTSRFNLRKHIHFETEVVNVEELQMKKFNVQTKCLKTGEMREGVYDAVAVCTGTNRRPRYPDIPGLDTATCEVNHSYNFTYQSCPKMYKDKRVAVVGFGESAADSFREVAKVAKSTMLCLRSYPFLVQRQLHDDNRYLAGEASDAITSPGHHFLVKNTFMWVVVFVASMFMYALSLIEKFTGLKVFTDPNEQMQGDKDSFGQVKGKVPMMDLNTWRTEKALKLQGEWNSKSRMRNFATKNYSAAHELCQEASSWNASGVKSVEGNVVHFKDGSSTEVDSIMLNTGYKDDFAFLPKHLRPMNAKDNFKNAFHPECPTLCFVGWARPTFGGVPICSEMVARHWMQLLDGEKTLPANVKEIIEADKKKIRTMYPMSTIGPLVDLFLFMDELGELIGCKPNLLKLAFTEPMLFYKYCYGQHVPNWYRLHGPGSNFEEQAEVIRKLPIALRPWNVVKHSFANVVNSATGMAVENRYDLHEFFNL